MSQYPECKHGHNPNIPCPHCVLEENQRLDREYMQRLRDEIKEQDAELSTLRAENSELRTRLVTETQRVGAIGVEACEAMATELATVKAENERLKESVANYASNLGDIVTYGTTADVLDQHLQTAATELASLKSENAELRKDKERWDAVETNCWDVRLSSDGSPRHAVDVARKEPNE